MFGWLSRCWGGMGVRSQFQKARIRSTITDWKVPDDQDICILINSFKDENPQLPARTALDHFFSSIETDEQKQNPIFLLKNLYILDQTVEEHTALETIQAYYNSDFLTFPTANTPQNAPIRGLVTTYFLYVTKKAELYAVMERGIFSKAHRRLTLTQMTQTELFTLVDRCLIIQKHINQINSKYKGRSRSVELIQMVFTMLLKTYLLCYGVVSTCALLMFKRLTQLKVPQLEKMHLFLRYINKEYTRNYIDFIESNKEIEAFKSIKYSQLISIDQVYLDQLQHHIEDMQAVRPSRRSPSRTIVPRDEQAISEIPHYNTESIMEGIKVMYYPRKFHKQQEATNDSASFTEYQNLYHDEYDEEPESSIRKDFYQGIATNPEKVRNRSASFNTHQQNKFQATIWNDWQNVYSEASS